MCAICFHRFYYMFFFLVCVRRYAIENAEAYKKCLINKNIKILFSKKIKIQFNDGLDNDGKKNFILRKKKARVNFHR